MTLSEWAELCEMKYKQAWRLFTAGRIPAAYRDDNGKIIVRDSGGTLKVNELEGEVKNLSEEVKGLSEEVKESRELNEKLYKEIKLIIDGNSAVANKMNLALSNSFEILSALDKRSRKLLQ